MAFIYYPSRVDSYYTLDSYFPLPPVILPNYVEYEDLNYNSELRRQMVRYFSEKIDHWLHDGFSDLLKYFKARGDSAEVVDKMEDARERDLSDKDREKIIDFMKRFLLNKHDIEKMLSHFVKRTYTNWYDLRNYKEYVKDHIHHELKKKIKEAIYEKQYQKSHK